MEKLLGEAVIEAGVLLVVAELWPPQDASTTAAAKRSSNRVTKEKRMYPPRRLCPPGSTGGRFQSAEHIYKG
jgi:hypothetical protein